MAKQYKVLVNAGKEADNRIVEVPSNAATKGAAVHIKAKAGAKYQLQEIAEKNGGKNVAPDYVKTKRVGKDLHIIFEGDKEPSVIIDDYYKETADGFNGLIGQAENGSFYEYIPEDPNVEGLVPNLRDGAEAVNVALGGNEVQAAGAAVGLLLFNPLLAGLGLLGAAAAAGGGGGAAATTAVTPTGALATASDSGLKGDNKTNIATPALTGKATPGSTVEVQLNGKTYTTTADANGDYTVNITDKLPDGTYNPVIKVTSGGNSTSINATPFTIDSTTTVLITNTGAAGTVRPISGTAEAGDTVVLTDKDGKVIGSTTAGADGKWSITPTTAVPAGTLTATATDVSGNTATNLAPTGALQLDGTSDSGTLGDNKTNVTTPALTGKATPGATVEVLINGKTYTTTADAKGDYSLVVKDPLPDGTYTPIVKVTNPSGTSSISATPFTVDTTTSVNIESAGTAGAPGTAKPISGTAEPGAVVLLKDNVGSIIGSTTAGPDGRWSLTPTKTVPDGKITATATDPAGNTATDTDSNVVATPNVPTISSVVDNVAGVTGVVQKFTPGATGDIAQGNTNDTTPTINGTATPGSVVKIYDNGTLVGSTTAGTDGKWSFEPTLTAEGVHKFAVSSAAATAPETATYDINLDTTAPAKPQVDPTNNNSNTGTGTGNTFSVIDNVGATKGVVPNQGTTDDNSPVINGKGTPGDIVKIYDNGVVIGSTTVDPDGKWSFKPTTPLTDGTHAIATDFTDPAGNTSTKSDPVNFTIDTNATAVSLTNVTDDVAAVTGSVPHNGTTNDSTPTISGKGTPGTVVTIKDGNIPLGSTTVLADGTWSFTPSTALAEGTHNLNATGTDSAGNTSTTGSFPIKVDTTAPAAPSIDSATDDVGTAQGGFASGVPTDDSTPTLTGKAEAGSIVTIKDADGKVVGSTTADANGKWSYTLPALPADGTYKYTASTKDAAGNTSPESAPFIVKLDTSVANGGQALGLTIDTDANNDGQISFSEIGNTNGTPNTNLTVTATFDKTKVNVGDVITFTDTATGGAVKTVTLDANMVAAGKATATFTSPGDGNNFNVKANLKNPAGNTTPDANDTAKLDLSNLNPDPNNNPGNKANVGITITTDANNDGTINVAELAGKTKVDVKITLPTDAKAGDTLIVTGTGNDAQTIVLTSDQITAKSVTTSFTAPANGSKIDVTAQVSDTAGNKSAIATDTATVNTTPAGAPTPVITTDGNSDGFINKTELNGASTVTVKTTLPGAAKAGDTITVTDGTTVKTHVLTSTDITNKSVSDSFTAPANGSKIDISATLTTAAGNVSDAGTASAKIDSSNFANPTDATKSALLVNIDTDANNDGLIGSTELGATSNKVKTTITLAPDAAVGDTLTVKASGNTDRVITLQQADITAGKVVLTDLNSTGDNTTFTVSASLKDQAGNATPTPDANDSATIKSAISGAPVVTISEDKNDDGTINASEKSGDTDITIALPTAAAVGDKLNVTINGTVQTITLAKADIDAKAVSLSSKLLVKDGDTLTVKATLTNAAGDVSPEGSDTAKLQTTASNGGNALGLTIDTDANNDGQINFTEIGSTKGVPNSTLTVTATFDSTKVAVGDVVTFSPVGGTAKTVTLTADDVKAGKVTTTFTSPGDGNSLTVTATLTDKVGNVTPEAKDTAKLDLSNLNPDTTDPTNNPGSKANVGVKITTDRNDDNIINSTELAGGTKVAVTVTLPTDAKAGDDLVITGTGNNAQVITLTPAHILAKEVVTSFNAPTNGSKIDVTAQVSDTAGNMSNVAKDTATVNTTPTGAPTVEITTDGNNDGFINRTELNGATKVNVKTSLPAGAAVNDIITVTDGTTVSTHTLTTADLTAGAVTDAFNAPANGGTISVSATLTTVAGNVSEKGTDKATIDTSNFVDPLDNTKTGLQVNIDTDDNNDKLISNAELGATSNKIKATITLAPGAAEGDTLTVKASGNTDRVITLTAAQVQAGKVVLTDLNSTGDNTTFTVSASLKDQAGNATPTPDATDSATIKSVVSGAPVVTISEDTNNDGTINATELSTDKSVDITITLPTAAVAGDVLNVTINGTARAPITLTAEQITAKALPLTITAPAEGGTVTVTATLKDAAGNVSPEGSDTAKLVTIASNGGNALDLTIDTDINNDGQINFTEIGNTSGTPNTTLTVSAAFDKTKVAVGDIITFSPTGGTAVSVALKASDITAGKVSTTFTSPGDGNTFTVKATLTDKVGNVTPDATDTAKLDLSNLNPVSPSTKLATKVEIIPDGNNDNILNATELNGSATVSIKVSLPTDAKAGDTLIVTGTGSDAQTIVLSADHITAKSVTTTFATPANGSKIDVTAQVSDTAGNKSNVATDTATVNTTPTGAPTPEITTDGNGDGFINKTELGTATKVNVQTKLPSGAAVNDVITVTDGTTTSKHTLTSADLTAGFVTDNNVFAAPANGGVITINATLTTVAGNVSAAGTDKATIDTSNFTDSNGKSTLAVKIDTDANDDALISNAELSATSNTVKATITLAGDAAVGDTLTIKASGNTDRVITLKQSDITAGKVVITDFNPTGNNTTFNVSASLKDQAGNATPTPDAADSATVKSTISGAPTVTITEDGNNDGTISKAELSSNVDITIGLPTAAVAGDTLNIVINGTTESYVLKAADITAGSVARSIAAPADGGTVTAKASLTDAAGNVTAESSDTAKLDTTAPNGGAAPTLVITTDINNDGLVSLRELADTNGDGTVSAAELTAATSFNVKTSFDKTKVVAGDKIVYSDGTSVTLNATDVSNGFINTAFTKPADGGTLTLSATVQDSVGNASTASATDSAKLDTTAPTQTVSFSSMTKDSGLTASNSDWTTTDSSAGRLVSGTVSAALATGDTVAVFVNNGSTTSFVGTATVSADGKAWAITDTNGYNAGWTYTAQVFDAAGNSGNVTTQVVNRDTSTAPAAPVITDIGTDATFATKIANAADTSDNTLAVRGTGEAGSFITLYDNTSGNVVKSGILVDSTGKWTADLTSTELANGTHNFHAVQTNAQGMGSALSNQYATNILVNLVSNGSFEGNNITGNKTVSGSDVVGWKITSGNMDLTPENTNYGVGISPLTPWGSYMLDTSGTQSGTITQDIKNLVVGQTYSWSFSYARFFESPSDTLRFELAGAENLSQAFTPTEFGKWITVTNTFVAKSSTVSMTFINDVQRGTDDQGVLIDNVILSRVDQLPAPDGSLTAGATLGGTATTGNDTALTYTSGPLNALAGKDTITVVNSDLQAKLSSGGFINGGGDVDTLKLAAGTKLDLTALTNNQTVKPIQEVESFQMQGGSSLTLSANDVLSLGQTDAFTKVSNGKVQMLITGTTADQLNLKTLATDGVTTNGVIGNTGLGGEWVAAGTVLGKDGVTMFNVFNHSTTNAQVLTNAALVPSTESAAVAFTSMSKDSGTLNADWLTSDGSSGRVVSGTLAEPLASGSVVKIFSDGSLLGNATVSADGKSWEIVDTTTTHTTNWTYRADVVSSSNVVTGTSTQVVTTDFTATPPVIAGVIGNSGNLIPSTESSSGLTSKNLLKGGDSYSTTNWSASASDGYLPTNLATDSPLTTGPAGNNNAFGAISVISERDGTLFDAENPTGLGSLIHMASANTVNLVQGQSYKFAYDAAWVSNNSNAINTKWVLVDENNVFVKEVSPWYTTGGTGARADAVQLTTSWVQYDSTFYSDLPTGNYRLAMALDCDNVNGARDIWMDRVYLGWTPSTDTVDAVVGTGQPGDIVYLYDNSTNNLVGSTTVQADGTWSLKPSSTYSGSNSFSAKTLDPSGNLSTLSNVYTVNDTGTNALVNGDFSGGNTGFTTTATATNVVSVGYLNSNNAFEVTSNLGSIPANSTSLSLLNQTTSNANLTWSKTFNGTTVQSQIGSSNALSNPDGAITGKFLTGSFASSGTIWQESVNVVAGKTYTFRFDYISGNFTTEKMNVTIDGTKIPFVTTTWENGHFIATYVATTSKSITLTIKGDNTAQGASGGDYFLDNFNFSEFAGANTLVAGDTAPATPNVDSLTYTGGTLSALGGSDTISAPTNLQSLLTAGGTIRGDAGIDTLKLASGATLDLTKLTVNQTVKSIQQVEIFEMTGSSTLIFSTNDVLSLGQTNAFTNNGKVQFMIKGTSTDSVSFQNLLSDAAGGNNGLTGMWVKSSSTVSVSGVTFNVYDHSTTGAQVLVQSAIPDANVSISASPLVLDLNGDGVQTTDLAHGAQFDLMNAGSKQSVAWVEKHDGLLAIDLTHDGQINSGAELLGTSTKLADGSLARDGWQALAQYDGNADGVIDAKDAVFKDLQVWVDGNGDGASGQGEVKSLADLGIQSINLHHDNAQTSQNGNVLQGFSSYTTTDGQTHQVTDAWLNTQVGGTAVETFKLVDSGMTLDLTAAHELKNVATVDLTGTGANTLKLDVNALISLSDVLDNAATSGADESKMLVINGNSDDKVELVGGDLWSTKATGLSAADLESTFGADYHFTAGHTYAQHSLNGATVFRDELVTLNLV